MADPGEFYVLAPMRPDARPAAVFPNSLPPPPPRRSRRPGLLLVLPVALLALVVTQQRADGPRLPGVADGVQVTGSGAVAAPWAPLFTDASGLPGRVDPCRPVHVVTNLTHSPPSGPADLKEALARVSEATGITFVDDGLTTEVPDVDRPLYDPARWGESWAPLLVAWMPAAGSSFALDDRVEGATLPQVVPSEGGPSILSAQVVLNADLLLPPGFGPGLTQGEVLLHELGHALGLAHVADPGSIMYPTVGAGEAVLNAGDRQGFAALGAAAGCHPAPRPQQVTRG